MKKLTIDNLHELQPWIRLAGYEDCNANVVTMLMWQVPYPFFFEVHEHFALACFRIEAENEWYWYMPFCAEEHRMEAIQAMLAHEEIPPRIACLSREWRDWLQARFPGRVLCDIRWDGKDYIYSRAQQETLKGKKMQKRRNHYNAFVKAYAGRWEFHRLTRADFDGILAFLKEWQDSHDEIFGIREEEQGIRFLLEHFERLGLDGGVITIDGVIKAFCIVSHTTPYMLDIHVEKADRNIRGLYIAILKQYLQIADPAITLINREDDMGLPALIKAKHDMHPLRIPQKYTAVFTDWEITAPAPSDKAQLQQLWLESFADETPATAAFYFDHLYHPQDCRILRSHEQIIAMCMFPRWQLSLDGIPHDFRFLEGVAVRKEYRRCGYMKRLLNHVFQEFADARWILQAYDWDLYVSFGFAKSHFMKRVILDKTALPPKERSWTDADAAICLSLYETMMRGHDGFRIRDLTYYQDFWLPYQACCGMRVQVFLHEGQAEGYACWEEREEERLISELVCTSEAAALRMLASLTSADKTTTAIVSPKLSIPGKSEIVPVLMAREPLSLHTPCFLSECL